MIRAPRLPSLLALLSPMYPAHPFVMECFQQIQSTEPPGNTPMQTWAFDCPVGLTAVLVAGFEGRCRDMKHKVYLNHADFTRVTVVFTWPAGTLHLSAFSSV
jgi:hypothetical protein